MQIYFQLARDAAAPYIAKHKWLPFDGTSEIVPGITPVPLPGHTPGHTGYLISSQGKTLLVSGETLFTWSRCSFLTLKSASNTTPMPPPRLRPVKPCLSANNTLVAGAHTPWPAIGYVRKDGTGYRWVPVIFADQPGTGD